MRGAEAEAKRTVVNDGMEKRHTIQHQHHRAPIALLQVAFVGQGNQQQQSADLTLADSRSKFSTNDAVLLYQDKTQMTVVDLIDRLTLKASSHFRTMFKDLLDRHSLQFSLWRAVELLSSLHSEI